MWTRSAGSASRASHRIEVLISFLFFSFQARNLIFRLLKSLALSYISAALLMEVNAIAGNIYVT